VCCVDLCGCMFVVFLYELLCEGVDACVFNLIGLDQVYVTVCVHVHVCVLLIVCVCMFFCACL